MGGDGSAHVSMAGTPPRWQPRSRRWLADGGSGSGEFGGSGELAAAAGDEGGEELGGGSSSAAGAPRRATSARDAIFDHPGMAMWSSTRRRLGGGGWNASATSITREKERGGRNLGLGI